MSDPLSKQVEADLGGLFRPAPPPTEPVAPLRLGPERSLPSAHRRAGAAVSVGTLAAAALAGVAVVLFLAQAPPGGGGGRPADAAIARADQALDMVVGSALKPAPPQAPPRVAPPAETPVIRPAPETPTTGPLATTASLPTAASLTTTSPLPASHPAPATAPPSRPALDLKALASGVAAEAAAPPSAVAAGGVRGPPCAGPPGAGCTDPELSAASRELDRAFQDAQRAGVSSHDLRTEHDTWVSVQASASALSKEGLLAAYRSRIAQLRDLTGAAAQLGGAATGPAPVQR